MQATFSSRILALLAFLILASLWIGAAGERADLRESDLSAQSPGIEHIGCHLGHPAALCGLDAYPAGDLFIVEPSFG